MDFLKKWSRWLLAGFPILGINFIGMLFWSLILPTEIAYWFGFISTSPLTYITWKFIENWKR